VFSRWEGVTYGDGSHGNRRPKNGGSRDIRGSIRGDIGSRNDERSADEGVSDGRIHLDIVERNNGCFLDRILEQMRMRVPRR